MLDTPLILGTLVAVQMFYGPGVDDGPGVGDDFRPAHGPDADVDDGPAHGPDAGVDDGPAHGPDAGVDDGPGPGVQDEIAGTAGLPRRLAPRKWNSSAVCVGLRARTRTDRCGACAPEGLALNHESRIF